MICVHDPEGSETKAIHTADPHRVALLTTGNNRVVVHLQDDMPSIVNVGEAGGNGGVVIEEIDVTYRR